MDIWQWTLSYSNQNYLLGPQPDYTVWTLTKFSAPIDCRGSSIAGTGMISQLSMYLIRCKRSQESIIRVHLAHGYTGNNPSRSGIQTFFSPIIMLRRGTYIPCTFCIPIVFNVCYMICSKYNTCLGCQHCCVWCVFPERKISRRIFLHTMTWDLGSSNH